MMAEQNLHSHIFLTDTSRQRNLQHPHYRVDVATNAGLLIRATRYLPGHPVHFWILRIKSVAKQSSTNVVQYWLKESVEWHNISNGNLSTLISVASRLLDAAHIHAECSGKLTLGAWPSSLCGVFMFERNTDKACESLQRLA